ncbi:hypothetical protein NUW58_g2715 [Xylaria curta]|uniref:Uncharacterized protein n=1 Tax=Xylaria curta TaxID=42375 RepID=A0ACC1PF67_9PEZI|nr:hypothetical protein NUW58_g2715 [Xylaria curta]
MRFLSFIQLLVISASGALSESSDVEGCVVGERMDVNISALPEGIDPNNIRKCAEHPLSGLVEPMDERACHWGDPAGCTRGYCWKSCGLPNSGNWCWTATHDGWGDWIRCNANSDCRTSYACGTGNCAACGCSC